MESEIENIGFLGRVRNTNGKEEPALGVTIPMHVRKALSIGSGDLIYFTGLRKIENGTQ
jgi:hypothetical protein